MAIANPQQLNNDFVRGQRRRIRGLARRLWERWKHLARKIGDFQARALMTLFYFLILGPLAMVLRWRSDPLAIKAASEKGWRHREDSAEAHMEQARRQS